MKRIENNTFGGFLRTARARRRLSIRELATASAVSATYISLLERNRCRPPSDGKLVTIAEALNMSEDEVFVRAGRFPRNMPSVDNLVMLFEALRKLGSEEIRNVAHMASEMAHRKQPLRLYPLVPFLTERRQRISADDLRDIMKKAEKIEKEREAHREKLA